MKRTKNFYSPYIETIWKFSVIFVCIQLRDSHLLDFWTATIWQFDMKHELWTETRPGMKKYWDLNWHMWLKFLSMLLSLKGYRNNGLFGTTLDITGTCISQWVTSTFVRHTERLSICMCCITDGQDVAHVPCTTSWF